MVWDVIVIGGGPGGLQSAIAAASEGLKVLVLEKGQVGGQIGQTPLLENSVFANGGITGPEFAKMMKAQAEEMGAYIRKGEVISLSIHNHVKRVIVRGRKGLIGDTPEDETFEGHTVVLAMGNKWRELNIPGLKEQVGRRVYFGPVKSINYNATGREVAVYGGGPSAGQAILALADQSNTKHVRVFMRSVLNMPQYLVDRIEAHPKVTVYQHTNVAAINNLGDGQVAVAVTVGKSKVGREYAVDALFLCNGLLPATDWLKGTLALDEEGRVINTDLETSMRGVFAVGDCRSGSTARVGVAIGDGSMAVTKVWRYFEETKSCSICRKLFKKVV